MKAVIIDDQKINIETLSLALAQYCPQVHMAGSAVTVAEGFNLINREQPDIVFLDVDLGGDTGFELLRMFRQVLFRVIFITAYSDYAVAAFRENATDYLLKPLDMHRLQEAVNRAEQQLAAQKPAAQPAQEPLSRISLPTQEGYLFVATADIMYCQASGSYCHFFLNDQRKLTVSMPMKECEALLQPPVFCRVHHSYIVNLHFVNKYVRGRGGHIELLNKQVIEVSAARRDEFLKLMRR